VSEQCIARIVGFAQLFFGEQVMDAAVALPTKKQATGTHLMNRIKLPESLLTVQGPGNQVMERQESLSAAQLAGTVPPFGSASSFVARTHGLRGFIAVNLCVAPR